MSNLLFNIYIYKYSMKPSDHYRAFPVFIECNKDIGKTLENELYNRYFVEKDEKPEDAIVRIMNDLKDEYEENIIDWYSYKWKSNKYNNKLIDEDITISNIYHLLLA